MKQAGYSDKTLLAKLGYKADETILVFNPPEWFQTELQKEDVKLAKTLPATWVHGFFTRRTELDELLLTLDLNQIEKGLWVSWPKKSSNIPTDLSDQIVRNMVLALGWVDIKVAAIDETWSGLKFTRRKK